MRSLLYFEDVLQNKPCQSWWIVSQRDWHLADTYKSSCYSQIRRWDLLIFGVKQVSPFLPPLCILTNALEEPSATRGGVELCFLQRSSLARCTMFKVGAEWDPAHRDVTRYVICSSLKKALSLKDALPGWAWSEWGSEWNHRLYWRCHSPCFLDHILIILLSPYTFQFVIS